MVEIVELDIGRSGRRRDRHVIVAGMEWMVVWTKGDKLRGVVHERKWFPIEGIGTMKGRMNWLAILRDERCLGIGRRGITIVTNVRIRSPAHGSQLLGGRMWDVARQLWVPLSVAGLVVHINRLIDWKIVIIKLSK
jgi:hypothetical protein